MGLYCIRCRYKVSRQEAEPAEAREAGEHLSHQVDARGDCELRSLLISKMTTTDQNHGIDMKCLSMLIIADQFRILISIDWL